MTTSCKTNGAALFRLEGENPSKEADSVQGCLVNSATLSANSLYCQDGTNQAWWEITVMVVSPMNGAEFALGTVCAFPSVLAVHLEL